MAANETILTRESFRDSVATISKEGKRNYINPKKPKGKLYRLRTLFSIFYLAVFFSLPFIKVHGEPLLLFNIPERRFIIFGMIFWPQDFFIFGIAMLTFMVFIILFTVVFGRIFCGWACPQTIFMEMVFRKIEYWIDGDANQQKLLKKMPWNAKKIQKRVLKFVVFFLISFLIANFFLSYIIGMDQLLSYVQHPFANIPTLISLLIFTSVFFFVYWWFREQVCIVVCPYGRLQGVLLDQNSIVVAYDYKRGEPRGKLEKKPEAKVNGDCIDCLACVRVCPTGIDIRNGTQLECVNCTACIDACDAIMEKINRPKGLIRYASHDGIEKRETKIFNARTLAYSIALFALLGILGFAVTTRSNIETNVFKVAGTLYTRDGSDILNLYNLEFVNKTFEPIEVDVRVESPAFATIVRADGKQITIPAEG